MDTTRSTSVVSKHAYLTLPALLADAIWAFSPTLPLEQVPGFREPCAERVEAFRLEALMNNRKFQSLSPVLLLIEFGTSCPPYHLRRCRDSESHVQSGLRRSALQPS